MKDKLKYIWMGLGLIAVVVVGGFVLSLIQEKRMANYTKKMQEKGKPKKVAAEQASNGLASIVATA